MKTRAAESSARAGSRRDTTINLRLPEREKSLIDAAAAAVGKTRTDFVLQSARREAIDVLLDQRLLELDGEEWEALMRSLDDPPLPSEALRRLMGANPPWRT